MSYVMLLFLALTVTAVCFLHVAFKSNGMKQMDQDEVDVIWKNKNFKPR